MSVHTSRLLQRGARFWLLLGLAAALVVSSGCVGGGRALTQAPGWAGVGAAADLLVAGTTDGAVTARDPASGAQRWRFPRAEDQSLTGVYGAPVVGNGRVYLGAYNGTVYALNAQGEEQWKYPSDGTTIGPVMAAPVLAGNLLLVPSSDGKVYALDAATGRKQQEFVTGNKVWASPTVDKDRVYVASMDHTLRAFSLASGQELWRFDKAQGALATQPLVLDGLVVVGSLDRNLYAVDAATGTERWRFPATDWFWAAPVSDGTRIYVATLDGKVYALNTAGGREWVFQALTPAAIVATPLLIKDGLVVADDNGRLSLLDPATSQEEWSYNLDAGVRGSMAVQAGTVFIGTMTGQLRAVDVVQGRQLWSQDLKKK